MFWACKTRIAKIGEAHGSKKRCNALLLINHLNLKNTSLMGLLLLIIKNLKNTSSMGLFIAFGLLPSRTRILVSNCPTTPNQIMIPIVIASMSKISK